MATYTAWGLTIASELVCPELRPGAGAPDVHVYLQDPTLPTGQSQVGYEASALEFVLRVPKVGCFTLIRGQEIRIEPFTTPPDFAALRLFLLGTVMGAVLHQRGVLPLHGSAVCRDGSTLLILGRSGAGKSSLAAALSRDGWKLQSDDICAVRIVNGVAICDAGFPRRKMWPDMLMRLGEDPSQHERVRETVEKRSQIVLEHEFEPMSAPIRSVVVLGQTRDKTPAIRDLPAPIGMAALKKHTFRDNLRNPLGLHLNHFQIISTLAGQATIRRLNRPQAGGDLESVLECLRPALAADQAQ
jgi:hypothetical protein